jgi:hypothetical protein
LVWPPDVDVSCGYIEQAVVDSQQGVVLQLGGSGNRLKSQCVMECYTQPETWTDPLKQTKEWKVGGKPEGKGQLGRFKHR